MAGNNFLGDVAMEVMVVSGNHTAASFMTRAWLSPVAALRLPATGSLRSPLDCQGIVPICMSLISVLVPDPPSRHRPHPPYLLIP